MKIYIATLVKNDEYFINPETFVGKTAEEVAKKVSEALDLEDVPYDFSDVLVECGRENQSTANPLSLGVDTDLCHEWLLSTSIQEV